MKLAIEDMKTVNREILLAFWKVHILHHAAEGPVIGQWMLKELRRHGYDVSPGTLYPMLQRMESNDWLRSEVDPTRGPRGPRKYYLTEKGGELLALIGQQVAELYEEIGRPDSHPNAAGEEKA